MNRFQPQLSPPLLHAGNALFLDFDGTLTELAQRPEWVEVPPELINLVRSLCDYLQGAVAVISGRPLGQIDTLMEPLRLPGAGVHGNELRIPGASGLIVRSPSQAVIQVANRLIAAFAGDERIVVEYKESVVALHYRQAPERMKDCDLAMQTLLTDYPELSIMHGSMVIEAWPCGTGKGLALTRLMSVPPFEGREPVVLGDDTTDEDGFRTVGRLSGFGIKVGAGETAAHYRLADVPAVHRWLSESLAATVMAPA